MEWRRWLPRSVGARCWRVGAAAATGLALAAAVGLPPAALAAQMQTSAYTDVAASSQYAPAIGLLSAAGVLNGYPDRTFRPDQHITRAEFTKAVVALFGPKATETSAALADQLPTFADGQAIPSWAWGYINYAQGRGLIAGYPDHTFRANNDVTMVEAATILVRAIADQAAVPPGAWPTNYTIAAYDLNLTAGLTFVADQAATRGQTAQMLYDAALLAPTLQNGYTSGIPTGVPLYLGGNGFARSVWQGTVSSVSVNSISVADAQGHSLLTAPLTDPFYLFGAPDIVQTQGLQATVAEDPQGQVDFVSVQQGSGAKVATLATSSVALPAGYFRSGPFLVTSGDTADLLLADGTVIPLASTSSSVQGTEYYVNTPTAGLSADAHAAVAGATSLQPGATVSVTMNSSGDAVAVYEVETDVPLGVVTAVDTSSGTVSYTTGVNDQTAGTAIVQPWTTVTLNGSVSSAAALQKGDVVAIQFVGGKSSGDVNARSIAATRVVVSGEIDTLDTMTNGTTITRTIGLAEAGGQTRSIIEDAEFDASGASVQAGDTVTLALDSQGEARQARTAAAQQTVAMIEGTQQQTTMTSNGPVTTTQIVADSGGQHQVWDVASGVHVAGPPPTGYLAVVTFTPGATTVTVSGVTPLQQVTRYGSLSVLSDDGSVIVVQPTASAGNGGTALVLTKSAGAVVYHGETFQPFGSLTAGQAVTVWAAPAGPDLGVLVQ